MNPCLKIPFALPNSFETSVSPEYRPAWVFLSTEIGGRIGTCDPLSNLIICAAMGLRFRRSFKVFPGVRLNVSKGGLSTSFGVHGATLNVGKRGVRATVGIPGTGLSYSANLTPPVSGNLSLPNNPQVWTPPTLPSVPGNGPKVDPYLTDPGMNEIGSSAVEWLTSQGLQDFRNMIKDAHRQRCEIKEDLISTQGELRARER